jgi:hypothetical protein
MEPSSTYPQTAAILLAAAALTAGPSPAQPTENMSFFITSEGPGNGADLGGLAGADQHCQTLAAAAGSAKNTWRAYLSSSDGEASINARDRIGQGPWYNYEGVLVASNIDELHGCQVSGLSLCCSGLFTIRVCPQH